MATKFSIDSLIDWAKEWLASVFTEIPGQLGSQAKTGLLGILTQIFGLGDKVDEYVEKAKDFTKEQVGKLDANLGHALQGTTEAITSFFSSNKSVFKISDAAHTNVEKIVKDATGQFLNAGIPKLDNEKNPAEAYKIAITTRDKIVKYLGGDENSVGAIPSNTPNRKELIENIATASTGVEAGSTLQSIAATPHTTGLVGMLANIQRKRYGTENGSVMPADATYVADPKILGTLAKSAQNYAGKDVTAGQDPKAPAGTKPNTPARGVK